MRYAPRAILAGGLGFAVSCLAACGGGAGLLSGDQSIALSGQGNEITAAVASGNCGAAINASAALNQDVQNLPPTINTTLRSNLTQGAATIASLAAKDCRAHTPTTPSIPTTTSSSTTSTPSTSSSTTTSTSTSTSTSSTTTPTTTTTATTPTDTGTSSNTTTSGGVGLGGTTITTGTGTGGTGGTGSGNGNSGGNGGGG